jgi:hypothetical protein
VQESVIIAQTSTVATNFVLKRFGSLTVVMNVNFDIANSLVRQLS